MKRDSRLVPLSRDHYLTLKLAKDLRESDGASPTLLAESREAVSRLRPMLEAHFRNECMTLIPALSSKGLTEMAQRIQSEHAAIQSLLETAQQRNDFSNLAAMLEEHVRYEERVVFSTLEDVWTQFEPQ